MKSVQVRKGNMGSELPGRFVFPKPDDRLIWSQVDLLRWQQQCSLLIPIVDANQQSDCGWACHTCMKTFSCDDPEHQLVSDSMKSACVTVPLLACAYEGAKEWKPHFLAWGSCDNPYPSLQKSWGWYTASWWTQKPSERIMKRKKTRFPSQVISVFPKRRGWLSFIQIKNQCFQHNFWANHFNETKVHFILQTSFVVTQISIASFSLWEKASA